MLVPLPVLAPWVATKNCPVALILVLWGSLTDPDVVCTVGWSGGDACGQQPQPLFRVQEHHKDWFSHCLACCQAKNEDLAVGKAQPICLYPGQGIWILWNSWEPGTAPSKDVQHLTFGIRYCMLTYDIVCHVWYIRCRTSIRYESTISYAMYMR